MITMRAIKLSLLLAPALLAAAVKSEADKRAILNDHRKENLLHSQFSFADEFAGIYKHFKIAEELQGLGAYKVFFDSDGPNMITSS